MRKSLVLSLLLVLAWGSTCLAETLSVAFSGAELRSAPNAMASKVILTAPRFYPVVVLEQGDEYYRVKDYRGRTGWLHRSLLAKVPATVVTGDRANVRKGPGSNHPALFQLAKGATARVLGKEGTWVRIETADGRSGWVADFLLWGE